MIGSLNILPAHIQRRQRFVVAVTKARISLQALSKVFSLKHVFAYDTDSAQAKRFASGLSEELRIEVEAVQGLGEAVKRSDICVTCTPSHQFFLKQEYVRPSTFIAAVGADSEDKQELEPGLIASNKVVVDVLDQCASIGELHHISFRTDDKAGRTR